MMTATSDGPVLYYHVLEIDKLLAGAGGGRKSPFDAGGVPRVSGMSGLMRSKTD